MDMPRLAALSASIALVAGTQALAFVPARPIGLAQDAAADVEADVAAVARAAEAGDARAMYRYARILSAGRGTVRDEKRAFEWYARAAEAGEPRAMTAVGVMYANGIGVERNPDDAVRWYRRAAEAGNTQGMVLLSDRLLTDAPAGGAASAAEGEREAARLLRTAAEAGDADAALRLGRLHVDGRGVERSPKEAVRWLSVAAAMDEVVAMEELGALHEGAMAELRDLAKAGEWYARAAEKGSVRALTGLGSVALARGGARGAVGKDVDEAVRLFTRAAELGDSAAMHRLGVLYDEGVLVERDREAAFRFLKRAADRGEGRAMGRVAEMYAEGVGTARNPLEAYFWAILAERSSAVRGDAVARPAAETRAAELGEALAEADRVETRARADAWRPGIAR